MDQKMVRGQHILPETEVDQKGISYQQKTTIDQQNAAAQQTAIEQEPKSDQETYPDQMITPEGNEAYLRQHQRHLKNSYPSCDMSEVSFHTERTDFPGSRHSSINTEPLTLDAEQIHEAKDQAVDVMQRVDTNEAFDIFTNDLEVKGNEVSSPEAGSQVFADQINDLVAKAQEVVDANQQQKSQLANKLPASNTNGQDGTAAPVDDTEKLKDD